MSKLRALYAFLVAWAKDEPIYSRAVGAWIVAVSASGLGVPPSKVLIALGAAGTLAARAMRKRVTPNHRVPKPAPRKRLQKGEHPT